MCFLVPLAALWRRLLPTLGVKKMDKMHINKTLFVLIVACFIPVQQVYAFIGGPPITTYSIGIIITNLGLFAFSFFGSIIFQGWHLSKRHVEIEHLEATLQSLKAK